MPRLTPYLGILAGLALGMLIMAVFGGTSVVTPNSASKLSIVIPTVSPTETIATSSPEHLAQRNVATPLPAPNAVTLTPVSPALASKLRGALVNILCIVPARSGLHSISGSGVFIDSKGIILTNAHVAQYFLLANRRVSCTVRSGSPARDAYDAALVYISPEWLKANPDVLTETSPSGSGEHDFALIAVTGSATTTPLPASFPALSLATVPPRIKTPVAIATYGAQFLESSQILSDLFPTVVLGSVKNAFTFGTNTIDVLALGGSAAAQEGSSGGGVIDASGKLVGTITTSTITGAIDTRSLNAITASYIRADYASETGQAIDLLLAQPTAMSVADYVPQLPALEAIITRNI